MPRGALHPVMKQLLGIEDTPAWLRSKSYSIFGIGVDRKHALKWLFHPRGPRKQVLVCGVRVKATFHGPQKVYVYSENALKSQGIADERKHPGLNLTVYRLAAACR
jgi:hypothetical protein